MKRHWISYGSAVQHSPMSYWVHIEADGASWQDAKQFQPPFPQPVAGQGYPHFFIEYDDVTYHFASLYELDIFIATLGIKLLPSILRLVRDRGKDADPGSHWLARMPVKTKPWRYREKFVKFLRECAADFRKSVPQAAPPPSE